MRWKIERGATSHSSAAAICSANSIARRLGTGSTPGWARQTGQVWTLGSSPKESSQPQNIFVRVASCTWISRPITASSSGVAHRPSPGLASKPIACSNA